MNQLSLRTPVVARRFWADEENDLTQLCEKCRAGFSLRRALARPRPCRNRLTSISLTSGVRRLLLICGFLLCAAIQAQVEQLATSGDGRVLLMHTRFRLQSETDLGPQAKIYRLQDDQWTRIAAAYDTGTGLSFEPPDVFGPFLSTDGSVFGWHTFVGCARFCITIIDPPFSSQLSDGRLPFTFPREDLRMSANARYFTSIDRWNKFTQNYLDSITGKMALIPGDISGSRRQRDVTNDGTVLIFLTNPEDWQQVKSPDVLALWKPGSDPLPIYSEYRIQSPKISANGGQVAFESIVEGGPDDDRRTLMVLNTQTGEQLAIAAMPPKDYRVTDDTSFAKPVWDADGAKMIYFTYDDREQPTAISLWEASTKASRIVLTSAEGFSNAAISGDGRIIWAATNSNLLLRLDLLTGSTDEILSPLPLLDPQSLQGVPGSAVYIGNELSAKLSVSWDGDRQLPLAFSGRESTWIQIPWEFASATFTGVHRLLIRSENNPFESVRNFSATQISPAIWALYDSGARVNVAQATHRDSMSFVTPSSPARPGETVHIYLTGLGPLDQPVPTGAPGPSSPLAHPLAPLQCRIGSSGLDSTPILIDNVFYAVDRVGFYQADLIMPDALPQGTTSLFCGTSVTSTSWTTSALLATTSVR